MNSICKNKSALALQRSRDLSAVDQQSASDVTTVTNPTEIGDVLDVFSTIVTDTEPPHYTNSTSGVATTSTDKFLNLTTSDRADADFYIADEGATVVATSFNASAEPLTSIPATTSAGR